MYTGVVHSIQIARTAAAPLATVDEVEAVAGKGLEGDRYCAGEGTFSASSPGPKRQVTLIEAEALEALERDSGISMTPEDSRRNITTRGIPLNHLVGREFRVGGAMLRGIELCEPCNHLQKFLPAGGKRALVHRGGLNAEVLQGGSIRTGDEISAGI